MAEGDIGSVGQKMVRKTKLETGGFPLTLKFDLQTALLCAALASPQSDKDLFTRLAVLVTARYNWQDGSLRTTHRQLEDLWSCSRSTVKRSLAEFERRGFICDRWYGVRGEASRVFLDVRAILKAVRPFWRNAGNDVVARLDAFANTDLSGQDSDVEMQCKSSPEHTPVPERCIHDGPTKQLAALLQEQGKVGKAALKRWIAPLEIAEADDKNVIVRANTLFVATYVERTFGDAIESAVRTLYPSAKRILYEAGPARARPFSDGPYATCA